ncbi:MAG: hypothetical protein GX638_05445 [Crenarchaeota archaeon]|nr:hypothetical protein [Thermoproteota archaeon]
MKKVFAAVAVLILLVGAGLVISIQYGVPKDLSDAKEPVFVGVTYCGECVEDAKLLIDRVKNCSNLFVLQSGTLQRDLESVNAVGDYAVECGLYFLPYFGSHFSFPVIEWIEDAKTRWGTFFLGVYFNDEPAGKMLDDYVKFEDSTSGEVITKTRYGDLVVEKPDGVVINYRINGVIHLFEPANYTGASYFTDTQSGAQGSSCVDLYATFYPNQTISIVESSLDYPSSGAIWVSSISYAQLLEMRPFTSETEISEKFYARNQESLDLLSQQTTVFTSDYALYWFDYQAGYDVVLSQIGWNNSFAQNIALTRGAANLQQKDWGAIITWKYDVPPYLDSGEQILFQMRNAYGCGAKYIILFNYYGTTEDPYGTLQYEHFVALESFWNELSANILAYNSIRADVAFVLPKDYACGMRWLDDRIWGTIPANETCQKIWATLQTLLSTHNLYLDIIYDDPQYQYNNKYAQLIYWNQTA